jgi:predicted metalloprotease
LELEVREPGKVAPFAVVGMLTVCLLAMLMLSQYASLVGVNDDAVKLKNNLETLQTEEAKLLTQYELAYDLQAIEQEVLASGEMVKPQSSQMQNIELTEPDSVKYYQNAQFGNGIASGIREIFSTIRAYF